MSEYLDHALPKSESGWQGGIRLRDKNKAGQQSEIHRYTRQLNDIPDPNFGRIEELKEKIRNKTLLSREAIEETAERIAHRLLGKDYR